MKHKIIFAIIILLASQPNFSFAKEVSVTKGFELSGNYFNNLLDDQKMAYLLGMVGGILAAPLYVGDEKYKIKWFADCLEDMTIDQIKAITIKYMDDNPVRWNNQMKLIFYRAMAGVCP